MIESKPRSIFLTKSLIFQWSASGNAARNHSPRREAQQRRCLLDFRLRQLQCFLVLSETLNFGKAARALYLSQPTLTFQIKSLEDSLGAKLFERNRHRVSLTDAGFAFREYAANMLKTAQAAKECLNQIASRLLLRVCCGPVGQYVVLPALIRALTQTHPEFQLEIVELTTEEQIAGLPEGKVDALLMVPELPIQGMRFESICSEPLVAMVSRQNPLAQKRNLSIHDLKEVGLIASRPRDCRFHREFLHKLFAPYGILPRIVESPQSCSVQFAYVAADEGVLLAPRSVTACAFPGIVSLPIQEDLPLVHLGLASMRTSNSVAMKIFRQVALESARTLTTEGPAAMPQPLHKPALAVIPGRREAV
jgi:DNA-binding transcriptional LysR family regulator